MYRTFGQVLNTQAEKGLIKNDPQKNNKQKLKQDIKRKPKINIQYR